MGTPNDPTVGGPDVDVHIDTRSEPEMDPPAREPEEPETRRPKNPDA